MKGISTLAALAALATLVACNSTGTSAPSASSCVYPAGTQVALAYPRPGASGVPGAPGSILIAATPALPSNWNVVIYDSGNTLWASTSGLQLAPAPYPSPYATPAFANPTYESASTSVVLPSMRTFTVGLNDLSSSCNVPIAVGNFTTQ